MKKPNLKPVVYWITEREKIRIARAAGWPYKFWTKDPIFQNNRFCCVRREDDRVTLWIRKNIRERWPDHPHLWFMLCAARQLNWPPTLEELINGRGWPTSTKFSPKVMADALRSRQDRDEKVFTGAYLLGGGNHTGQSKVDYIAKTVLGNLWRSHHRLSDWFNNGSPTLQGAVERLQEFPGWGPFLSYQAVVDMRFTKILGKAADRTSFACAGPGTRRGLNRVFGRPKKQPLSQEQALDEIQYIYTALTQLVDVQFDFSDVPNIMCETDKMIRVRNGEGKMRSTFTPSLDPLP